MKLTESYQVELSDVSKVEFDLIVGASGYESRATFIPSELQNLGVAATRKVALTFPDRVTLSRPANDAQFAQLGYTITPADGNSPAVIQAVLRDTLSEVGRRTWNILIDYTSMTRVWYAGVLDLLRSSPIGCDELNVYFTYAPSEFSAPVESAPNAHVEPIPGFAGLALPDRQTALIIGLGYERDRAIGLTEYVEPAEIFAFYADPPLDQRFLDAVLENNSDFLARLGEERTFTYPLDDLRVTAAKLSSLCGILTESGYRVILAPLGPKPFAFLCFLLAAQYRQLDVWRVSTGTGGATYDRVAIGRTLICRAVFVEEAVREQTDREVSPTVADSH